METLESFGPQGESPTSGDIQEEYITFKFKQGNPATLIIFQPTIEGELEEMAEEDSPPMSISDEFLIDMMREVYQDMKLSLFVEVEGRIVDTNATYRDGSKITIMEMDFGRLLEDEETFQRLLTVDPQSIEETKKLVKGSPGIKVEPADEVQVRFR